MEIKTHRSAVPRLVGTPINVEDDVAAEVELRASEEMAVDARGLIHGGFTFGLADYAAMLAVNHPKVVLGKSESRFVAPVRVGELMMAKASVTASEGRRREVEVEIRVKGDAVFKGTFTCYILDKHVLDI
ncbi:MAG: thioesterase [Candidatus Bathyarchaeota archaeon]|nr:thioesterase [Candidatus Bathyarchaeota archaeon]